MILVAFTNVHVLRKLKHKNTYLCRVPQLTLTLNKNLILSRIIYNKMAPVMHQSFVSPAPLGPGIAGTQWG